MLTERDRVLWEQFVTALTRQREGFERADDVPLVLVLCKVRGHHDDGASIGLEVPDVTILARPDVDPRDVLKALISAATVARSWFP